MDAVAVTSKVFVVQLQRNRNLAPAAEYGELVALLQPDEDIILNTEPHVNLLRTKLRTFTDADYIVPMGDPVAIGIVCALAAAMNGGRFKVLKWDKKMNNGLGGYWLIQVEL